MNKLSATLKSLAATFVVVASATISLSSAALAQQAYETPQKAVDALVAAARSDDVKGILARARPERGRTSSPRVTKWPTPRCSTGLSPHTTPSINVTTEGESKATLIVGDEDYPFPIPLVRGKNAMWSFDTVAGRREILYRRIGRNELSYDPDLLSPMSMRRTNTRARTAPATARGPTPNASSVRPGKKDGLYWLTAEGEDQSPLGELFADASAEGYKAGARSHAVSRLLLQDPDQAGPGGRGRRGGLHRKRQDDRRVRARRLSRGIPQFRGHDFHRQLHGRGVPEGSRTKHRHDRRGDDNLRSGFDLGESRRGRPGDEMKDASRRANSGWGETWSGSRAAAPCCLPPP